MSTLQLPTTRPPTVQDLPQLVDAAVADPARDRQLDRQLRGVLAELRARRRRRRALEAERARREHERTAEHALLLFGQLHVR
ncbi:hypothetical protein [Brachybacterium paraconglomeratum]|uniref:hypothetical protein n=1 Tax=Brachybacterium paraconglomeratum TaxID=173362 RepID=UPI003F7B907D